MHNTMFLFIYFTVSELETVLEGIQAEICFRKNSMHGQIKSLESEKYNHSPFALPD